MNDEDSDSDSDCDSLECKHCKKTFTRVSSRKRHQELRRCKGAKKLKIDDSDNAAQPGQVSSAPVVLTFKEEFSAILDNLNCCSYIK